MSKLLFLLFFIFSSHINAGVTVAKIERILLSDSTQLIYVYPEGGVNDPPACHTRTYYSFSNTRAMSNEYLSALLSAQARGAVVRFWGKNSCIDQSSTETLDYFRIEN